MNDFKCRLPMPPCKPEFPEPCPPDAKKPMPCMPPAPSVVQGQSLYEAVNNLTDRVNLCINTYNEVMANCYATLNNLKKAAEENGAYYGPCDIWTEEGYYADESATYTLVHKNVVDRRGEPIRIQLALAYGNTTNSKVEQELDSASKVLYADKIMVAQPMGANGWYGTTIWNGCPIPSDNQPTLYTMGFTRSGLMRVYNNSVTADQMLRDTIENSMGVSGVLVQNGQVMSGAYIENIPQYTEQTARVCIGQNTETKEVIILTCGAENNVNKKGLTSTACANILKQYGCSIAVELCEGNSAGAMDKGYQMFEPTSLTIPSAYCFWYISRSKYYNTDYEREVAELMQNMGSLCWNLFLTEGKINAVKDDLTTETENREQADQQLQENINAEEAAREAADTTLQNNIDAEEAAREAADTTLQNNIDAEEAAREAADTTLQNNIDAEKTARENADQQLQTDIDNETTAREQADTALKTELQNDYNTKISNLNIRVTALETDVSNLQTISTTLQRQTAENTATLVTVQQSISTIDSSLNNVLQTLEDIRNGTDPIDYLSLNGGTMAGAVNMGGYGITNLPAPTGENDAATKAYVDNANEPYTLPAATPTTLGGVKVGEGLTVTEDGTISATGGGASGDYLPISGGTLTGNLSLNGNILYLATGVPIKYNSDTQEIEIG